jgi:hypothetical protein
MESHYKTEEQAQFIAMMNDLVEHHGFNKSSVARLCDISPAMISAIVSGDRNPRFALERLQREYDKITKPQLTQSAPAAPRDVVQEKLEQLKQKDPDAYGVAAKNIEFLHDRMTSSPPVAREKDVSYTSKKKKIRPAAVEKAAKQIVDSVVESAEKSRS